MSNQKIFSGLVLLAFLVRLLLMPLSVHGDLIWIHYMPYFLSYHGVWDVYGYFQDHFLKHGSTYYQPLVFWLVAVFQWLIKPFNGGFDLFMETVHRLYYHPENAVTPQGFFAGFSQIQILRFAFTMKLPYLAADGGCLFLISKIFKTAILRRRALLLWLFNPVNIFSTYIFGQFRMFTAFFVWVVIYFMSLNRKKMACFFFGLLFLLETFPFVLFLPFILAVSRTLKERCGYAALALLLPLVVLTPWAIVSKGYVLKSYYSPVVQQCFLQVASVGTHAVIMAVVYKIILAGLLLWMIAFLIRNVQKEERQSFSFSLSISAATLFILYATTGTKVHYMMWGMPFFIVIQTEQEPWPAVLTWTAFFLLFLFNLDSRRLNLGLFIPCLGERAMAYPSLHEVMDHFLPWGKVVAAARLGFQSLCLFFTYRLYTNRIKPVLGVRP